MRDQVSPAFGVAVGSTVTCCALFGVAAAGPKLLRGATLAVAPATLPLTGSYAGVRRFVAEVLNELPHSALESLQIERATAQAKELQATARLVLFYGEESP